MTKMLVVDDEPEICEFLQEFFRDKGYEVFGAFRGDDALKIVEAEKPDLLLLDILMPGKGGLEILREAKKIHPKIKVIIVSALDTQDRIDSALKLGADSYITKPLSLDSLERDVQEKIRL